MEWQSIETAPKDGTSVLVLAEGYAIEAKFEYPYEGAKEKKWTPIVLDFHGCGCCGGRRPEPTHWAPLPDAPNAGNKGRT